MHTSEVLARLRREAKDELTEHILPYWTARTVDAVHGGFIGRITGANRPDPEAPKSVILNTRLLWTFSAAARALDDPACRTLADRAFAYLLDHFKDPVHGGLFWMVDHAGAPLETKKLSYAQGFGIYALAEYHRLTASTQAHDEAVALFDLLEHHAADADHGGYFEASRRSWERLDEDRLSDKDPVAAKSQNAHLHVLEAYTTLYRVWPSDRLRDRLRDLIRCFLDHIIDPQSHHLINAFDAQWHPVDTLVSYGHDIEASWLLVEAAEDVQDADLLAEVQDEALRMCETTLAEGVDDDGGLFNETHPSGRRDDDKHWWPQAEAVVGFLNAYQLTADDRYLLAARDTWDFIRQTIVDRKYGEWYFRVSRSGQPYPEENKVGPWKCPYHNARACLELMARIDAPSVSAPGAAPCD